MAMTWLAISKAYELESLADEECMRGDGKNPMLTKLCHDIMINSTRS